jgi:hypothetical protein
LDVTGSDIDKPVHLDVTGSDIDKSVHLNVTGSDKIDKPVHLDMTGSDMTQSPQCLASICDARKAADATLLDDRGPTQQQHTPLCSSLEETDQVQPTFSSPTPTCLIHTIAEEQAEPLLPKTSDGLLKLPILSYEDFLGSLKDEEVEQICVLTREHPGSVELNAVDVHASTNPKSKQQLLDAKWKSLERNPLFPLLREFADRFPAEVPARLPKDRGISHEIELKPGTKY